CLATEWKTSEDKLTWTLNLRSGVKFHDGTPFNADAVVFSLDRLINTKNAYRFGGAFGYAGSYRMIESMKSIDPLTVQFKVKEPSVVFLANLAMFPASIISPAAMKKHGRDFYRNPVGTGPFRFIQWRSQQKIVLKASDSYWGEKAGVETLIFKPVRENAARSLQLERGRIHIMDGIDFADIGRLKKSANVIVKTAPGMNFGYLAMNCEKKPFDNPQVRKAIAHAVDKAKILKLAYHGYGQPGVNPIPPTVWGYHDGIKDWPLDTAKARSLLRDAGFPAGLKTQLWAMPNPRPYMPQPRQVAQVLKETLKQIGVQVEIVSYDWNQYLDRIVNGEHPMCLLGWSTDNGDPDNFLFELLDKTKAVKGSANNITFYKSEEVHKLLIAAQQEFDPAKRKQLYFKAQEIIHEDSPMVPLAYLPIVAAHRKDVQGYKIHPTGLVRLHKVR
ncbi:MAG: ABC transporter substrate-binding protein, partial [Planctomycetota bacterium]|nr:ABC transporter substrate-binding protein [Planctomycetota bacterium]